MPASENESLKERVLDAARRLLAKDGYGGLSMRRLAQVVGCKAPSIYYHFENKDKIIHTLIDEGYDLQYRLLEAAASHEDPLRRIEARAHTYVDFAFEHPEYYRIMYMLSIGEMERYPKENYRRTRRALERSTADLEEAVERGLITLETDPYSRVTAGSAMLHGIIALILSHRLDKRIDRDAIVELVIQRALAPQSFGAQTPV